MHFVHNTRGSLPRTKNALPHFEQVLNVTSMVSYHFEKPPEINDEIDEDLVKALKYLKGEDN